MVGRIREGGRLAAAVALVLASLASACDELVEPEHAMDAPAMALVATDIAALGNPYVHFLPPVGPVEEHAGVFDPSVDLEISVYRGTAAPCPGDGGDAGCAPRVAHFARDTPAGVSVRVSQAHYLATWNARDDAADATYRIVAHVGAQALDFAFVTGVRGTLPIRIRIEEGALAITRAPVGEAGGTVEGDGGNALLLIPAGALDDEQVITIEARAPEPGVDDGVIGAAYELGPSGATFAQPITIRLKYDPTHLPTGVTPERLRLHRFLGSAWQPVPGSTVDTDAHFVSGETTHFSAYAVLEEEDAGVAAASGIIVTGTVAQAARYCALRDGGSAVCWGSNLTGQLGVGDPDLPFSAEPLPVAGGHTFTMLAGGANHVCGLRTDGRVYCWGNNIQSQLGAGSGPHQFAPVPVSGDLRFAALSAEGNTTCALDDDGVAYCWGNNASGEAGTGTIGGVVHQPAPVAGAHAFASIHVAHGHTCALTPIGAAYCWGSNLRGELGTGTAGPGTNAGSPQPAAAGHTFRWITGAWGVTCALDGQDQAWCWGNIGMLYDQDSVVSGSLSLEPERVAAGLAFTELHAAFLAICGLDHDGRAWCWGDNANGQVGTGDFEPRTTPALAADGVQFAAIAPNQMATCGITTTGQALCWGRARSGVLGNGEFDHASATPIPVAGYTFQSAAIADLLSCGLTTTGTAICWGSSFGVEPTTIAGTPPLTSLRAGASHFCGLDADGSAWCWGTNQWGQLGDGTTASRLTGAPVSGGLVFRAVYPGSTSTCALDLDDQLHCWGTNHWGSFGNGTTSPTPATMPVLAAGGMHFESVSAPTLTHMCGIDLAGDTYCWGGSNTAGEVGDGTNEPRLTPTRVAGDHRFTEVRTSATSNIFTCGLTTDGEPYCWGSNTGGTLGDGTTEHRNSPVPVAGGHAFADLALGFGIGCGVTAAGAAWCWSASAGARMGDGSWTASHLVPASAVPSLTVVSLGAGTQHSCAVADAGTMYCWGSNSFGQVPGLGPFFHTTAVAVLGGFTYLTP